MGFANSSGRNAISYSMPPRQTGKTSCLLALMKKLNEEGNYTALYAIPPEQLTLQVTTYLPPTPFLEKEKKTAVAMR